MYNTGMTKRDEDLRKLQKEELRILEEFVRVCEKENLKYYLLGGTLLGAVRHQGFIPWDDDMDVCMPRDDYEKFLSLSKDTFNDGYFICTYENDPSYRYPWARLCTTNMKIINRSANIPREEYSWIDLIPLDGFPDPGVKRTLHKIHLSFWWNLNQILQFDELVDQKRKRSFAGRTAIKLASCFKWMGKVMDYHLPLQKLNTVLRSCPYDSNTEDIINYLAAYGFKEVFPRSCFQEGKLYSFEGEQFVGPDDYDTVCRIIYGDYMTLPPEEDRNKHNSEIIS